jgi:predicted fused transcriptional regulator/phosphomethylpyrimidine kinase
MMNQLRGFIDVLDVDGRILQSVNRMAITHLRFGTRAYTEDSVEHDGISN